MKRSCFVGYGRMDYSICLGDRQYILLLFLYLKVLFNMKFIVILLAIVIYTGCSPIEPVVPPGEEQFEGGFTVLSRSRDLYRSNRYVAVKFVETVTPGDAEIIMREYSLTPVERFYHWRSSHRLGRKLMDPVIIMKLPKYAELENYLSNYPRIYNGNFGDLPEIKYCLPTFAVDTSGEPGSRVYISDLITVTTQYDANYVSSVFEEYYLEVITEIKVGEGFIIDIRVTPQSPKYPIDMANELHLMEEFVHATPSLWQYWRIYP
jgi:hypothetical protein